MLRREEFVLMCNDKYLSDLEIRRRIPRGWDVGAILTAVHRRRREKSIPIDLLSNDGRNLWFSLTQKIHEAQAHVDRHGFDSLFDRISDSVAERLKRDNLLEEALLSSQVEGAKTTHKRAIEMIRKGAMPRDKGERETLNNYKAMEFIIEHTDEELSVSLIRDLHQIVTKDALEHGSPGEFRTEEDQTVVGDINETVYEPPPPQKMRAFLDDLIRWTNESHPFIHPFVRASVVHFYFVYLHPFPDGNGRTARALYYFTLNKHYNAVPYISISHVIKEGRKAYDKAIAAVEKDGTDLTYFLHYSADITVKAIDNLKGMIDRYAVASRLEQLIGEREHELNKRQVVILKYMLRPNVKYVDLKFYRRKFRVVYETARNDMMQLVGMGILVQVKSGKKFIFKIKEAASGR